MPLKRDLFRQYRDFIEGLGSSGIQEVRENCIDDIRKGKSVHAKTLFALVTEDKAALEDTIRSMSDLRFSAFAHEFHQNLDVSLSYLTMTDQAFEEGYKGAEVIDEQLSRSRRVEGQQKRAILLIAQAGAGKSWLVEHFLQAFVGDFGAVVIDQDPWRFKLSDYVSRLKENESEAIAASQIITNKWVNDLLDVAIDEEDRDILFCTMLGSNVSAIIQLAQRLHKAGYIVEVQAMAVNQFISNMGAISRREEEIQQYGGGRSVASEKQSMAYYNIITGLNFFEKSKQLVKKLALIDRDAQPLFEKSLLDSGDWNKPGFIEDELIRWREREISQKEEERHCENFERTLFLQYSREASVAEKVHTEKSILDALHYFARSRLPEEPSEQKENDLWEEAQEKLVNIKKRANKLREEAIERDHELVRSATISMRDGNLFTEDGKQYSKLLQLKASRLPIDASLEYLRILVAIVSTPTADIPGLLGNVNPGKRAQLFDATKEQLKQAATHYLTKTHPAIIFSPSFTKEEKRTMFLSFADAFRTPAIDQLSAAAQQASEAGNQLESEIEKEIKEDNEKINVAFTAAQNNKLFDDGGVSYRDCLGVTASYLTPDSLSRFAIILHKGLTELPDHLNPGENHQLLMTSESARDSLAQFYIDAMHNNMSATGLSVGERTQYSLTFLKLLTASPPINQVSQNACELIAAYFVDAGPKELRTIELKQLFELTRFFAHLDGSPIYSDAIDVIFRRTSSLNAKALDKELISDLIDHYTTYLLPRISSTLEVPKQFAKWSAILEKFSSHKEICLSIAGAINQLPDNDLHEANPRNVFLTAHYLKQFSDKPACSDAIRKLAHHLLSKSFSLDRIRDKEDIKKWSSFLRDEYQYKEGEKSVELDVLLNESQKNIPPSKTTLNQLWGEVREHIEAYKTSEIKNDVNRAWRTFREERLLKSFGSETRERFIFLRSIFIKDKIGAENLPATYEDALKKALAMTLEEKRSEQRSTIRAFVHSILPAFASGVDAPQKTAVEDLTQDEQGWLDDQSSIGDLSLTRSSTGDFSFMRSSTGFSLLRSSTAFSETQTSVSDLSESVGDLSLDRTNSGLSSSTSKSKKKKNKKKTKNKSKAKEPVDQSEENFTRFIDVCGRAFRAPTDEEVKALSAEARELMKGCPKNLEERLMESKEWAKAIEGLNHEKLEDARQLLYIRPDPSQDTKYMDGIRADKEASLRSEVHSEEDKEVYQRFFDEVQKNGKTHGELVRLVEHFFIDEMPLDLPGTISDAQGIMLRQPNDFSQVVFEQTTERLLKLIKVGKPLTIERPQEEIETLVEAFKGLKNGKSVHRQHYLAEIASLQVTRLIDEGELRRLLNRNFTSGLDFSPSVDEKRQAWLAEMSDALRQNVSLANGQNYGQKLRTYLANPAAHAEKSDDEWWNETFPKAPENDRPVVLALRAYFETFPEDVNTYLAHSVPLSRAQARARKRWNEFVDKSGRKEVSENLLKSVREAKALFHASTAQNVPAHQDAAGHAQAPLSESRAPEEETYPIDLNGFCDSYSHFYFGGADDEVRFATYLFHQQQAIPHIKLAEALANKIEAWNKFIDEKETVKKMIEAQNEIGYAIDPEKGLRYLQACWDFIQRAKNPDFDLTENHKILDSDCAGATTEETDWRFQMLEFLEKSEKKSEQPKPTSVSDVVDAALKDTGWLRQSVRESLTRYLLTDIDNAVSRFDQKIQSIVPLLQQFRQQNEFQQSYALGMQIAEILGQVNTTTMTDAILRSPVFQGENWGKTDEEIKKDEQSRTASFFEWERSALEQPLSEANSSRYLEAIELSRYNPAANSNNDTWWHTQFSDCPDSERDTVLAIKNYYDLFTEPLRKDTPIEEVRLHVLNNRQRYLDAMMARGMFQAKRQLLLGVFNGVIQALQAYQTHSQASVDVHNKDAMLEQLTVLSKPLSNNTLSKAKDIIVILRGALIIEQKMAASANESAAAMNERFQTYWVAPLRQLNIATEDIDKLVMLRDFCMQNPHRPVLDDLKATYSSAGAECREHLLESGVSEEEINARIAPANTTTPVISASDQEEAPPWHDDEVALEALKEQLAKPKIADDSNIFESAEPYISRMIEAKKKGNEERLYGVIEGLLKKQFSDKKSELAVMLHLIRNFDKTKPVNIKKAFQETARAIEEKIGHEKLLATIEDDLMRDLIKSEKITLKPFDPGPQKLVVKASSKLSEKTWLLQEALPPGKKYGFVVPENCIEKNDHAKLKVGNTDRFTLKAPHQAHEMGLSKKKSR